MAVLDIVVHNPVTQVHEPAQPLDQIKATIQGVGPPVIGVTPISPGYYIDTSTAPDNLYWYDPVATTWNLIGGASPEGYTAANVPPGFPLVGDRWRNTSALTVAGVPPGVTSTWNGTTWDFAAGGASVPEVFTAAPAPPGAPAVGDRWRNTSAGTVSGVPPGVSATWTGGFWDFSIGIPEQYTSAAAAPGAPNVGDRWLNTAGAVVSGVPSGRFATWTGVFWEFVPTATDLIPGVSALAVASNFPAQEGNNIDAATPAFIRALEDEMYNNLPAPPAVPQIGKRWRNTSFAPVSGISTFGTSVWNGAIWSPEDFGAVEIRFTTFGGLVSGVAYQPLIQSVNQAKTIEYTAVVGPNIALVPGVYLIGANCIFDVTTQAGFADHTITYTAFYLINGLYPGTSSFAVMQQHVPASQAVNGGASLVLTPIYIQILPGDVLALNMTFFNSGGAILNAGVNASTVVTALRVQ